MNPPSVTLCYICGSVIIHIFDQSEMRQRVLSSLPDRAAAHHQQHGASTGRGKAAHATTTVSKTRLPIQPITVYRMLYRCDYSSQVTSTHQVYRMLWFMLYRCDYRARCLTTQVSHYYHTPTTTNPLLYTSHFTPSFCDSDLNRVRALNNESQCDHTAHVVIDIVTTEEALGPAAREAIRSGVHFCHVLCREVDSIQPTDHTIVGITLLL